MGWREGVEDAVAMAAVAARVLMDMYGFLIICFTVFGLLRWVEVHRHVASQHHVMPASTQPVSAAIQSATSAAARPAGRAGDQPAHVPLAHTAAPAYTSTCRVAGAAGGLTRGHIA